MVQFTDITKEMYDLYTRKNHDYGDSFSKSLDEDGLLVLKIRLMDKLSRFNNLIKHNKAFGFSWEIDKYNKVKDESLRDTLIDLANYAVMGLIWLDNKNPINDESLNLDTFTAILTDDSYAKKITGKDPNTEKLGSIKEIRKADEIDKMDRHEQKLKSELESNTICDYEYKTYDSEYINEKDSNGKLTSIKYNSTNKKEDEELIREVTKFLEGFKTDMNTFVTVDDIKDDKSRNNE